VPHISRTQIDDGDIDRMRDDEEAKVQCIRIWGVRACVVEVV